MTRMSRSWKGRRVVTYPRSLLRPLRPSTGGDSTGPGSPTGPGPQVYSPFPDIRASPQVTPSDLTDVPAVTFGPTAGRLSKQKGTVKRTL